MTRFAFIGATALILWIGAVAGADWLVINSDSPDMRRAALWVSNAASFIAGYFGGKFL